MALAGWTQRILGRMRLALSAGYWPWPLAMTSRKFLARLRLALAEFAGEKVVAQIAQMAPAQLAAVEPGKLPGRLAQVERVAAG
jgi:hypothetical protein